MLTVALQELGHFDVADFSTAFVALAKLPDSKSMKDNRLEALLEAALSRMAEYTASDLASIAHALAKMQ